MEPEKTGELWLFAKNTFGEKFAESDGECCFLLSLKSELLGLK